jgi:hypothetical protein
MLYHKKKLETLEDLDTPIVKTLKKSKKDLKRKKQLEILSNPNLSKSPGYLAADKFDKDMQKFYNTLDENQKKLEALIVKNKQVGGNVDDKKFNDLAFETDYALENFRKIQKESFDDENKAFKNTGIHGVAEDMLKLINIMEEEIIELRKELNIEIEEKPEEKIEEKFEEKIEE